MTPTELAAWLRGLAEAEAVVPARVVLARLPDSDEEPAAPEPQATAMDPSWRSLLWDVPSETRLGVHEVAEALGRSRSWVYKRTQTGATDRIPHRRLDGELIFTAGEVRAWIRAREDVVVGGPMDPPALRRAS